MQKKVGLACVVAIFALNVQAYGFGLSDITKMAKDSGEKVDVQALTTREAALKILMNKATVSLANGYIEIEKACGKAADAAKLEAAIEEAKKNPSDLEGTKKLCTEVNNAGEALKKMDLHASIDKNEARGRLGKSLLNLGAGTLINVQAANQAKKLLTDMAQGVNAAKASPMKYGVSAVRDLASGLNTAKFVAQTVPSQLGTITDITRGIAKYAQTNKIELPSAKEQEQMAKELEKE